MKRTIIAILVVLCTMVQGAWAADISNAIIYNPWRFLSYDGKDSYDFYAEFIEVYTYDNGWKKLRAPELTSNSQGWIFNIENADFIYSIKNSRGETVDEVREKGVYTLTVEGVNGYEGRVSQTLYITDSGNWSSYKADAFSNIDTANQIITIENEAEMARLAWNFNRPHYEVEYKEWTFRLARDLDLSAHNWIPIGSINAGDEVDFKGHFDGQGHTISGVHFERENSKGQSRLLFPQGLFAQMSNDRTSSSVRNLTLTDSDIASGRNEGAGGIVGFLNAESVVENCHVTNSVNVICMNGEEDGLGGTAYGGIVGLSYGQLTECTSSAHVFKVWDAGTCHAFGGIVGNCDLDMTGGGLSNCVYTGDHVMADSQTGAIAGGYTNSKNKSVTGVYFSSILSGCNGTDPNGITKPTVVTGNLSTIGTSGKTTWYYVNSDVTHNRTLTLLGDVRLVLADGKTMTVDGGNDQGMIGADASLSVYGQGAGTGRLAVSSTGNNAIQLYNLFRLYSGNVDAISSNAAGIYAGAIDIYGGFLNPSAPNEHNAIDASMGNITIRDGRINAIQCSAGYDLNITGGNVNFGQVYCKNVTLDWTRLSDFIYIGEYHANNIKVADGKSFLSIGDKSQQISGTINETSVINNYTLIPSPFSMGDDVVETTECYYIFTNDGWNTFCDRLEGADGNTFFQGKTVKLFCDINTTRMAANSEHEFSGTFDGQGHTLTVNYDNSEEYTAPFRFIRNANICRLNVEGMISTSQKFAAGIVAHTNGNNSIADCHVSATISSSVDGDGSHGGLAALLRAGMNVITDCSFTGNLLGENTNSCGGFIGWTETGEQSKTTLSNCLFNPTSLTIDIENCSTFARCYEESFFCCAYTYYINTFGKTQGEKAYAADPNLEDYAPQTLADGNTYFVYSPVFWTEEEFRDTHWGNDYNTASSFTISDEGDMAQFAYLVNLGNDFNGKTVVLANNIDMGQHYWLPAATMQQDGTRFRGTFDGDGHTINNLRANVEPGNIKTQASGLFGGIEDATVRNLTLHNLKAQSGIRDDVGGIAGHATGSIIENCHITSADISNPEGYTGRAAAIVACLQNSTIQGCTVSAQVSIYGKQDVGGIAAIALNANILGCVSNATVNSIHLYAGGIAAYIDSNSKLADCLFLGDWEYLPCLGGPIVGNTYGSISNTFYTDESFSDKDRYTVAEGTTCGYPHDTPPTTIGELTTTYQGGTTAYTNGLSYDNLFYMNSPYLDNGITTSLTLGSKNQSAGDNGAYYDLQGRRISVSSTLPKGIYIHNGKKIIK